MNEKPAMHPLSSFLSVSEDQPLHQTRDALAEQFGFPLVDQGALTQTLELLRQKDMVIDCDASAESDEEKDAREKLETAVEGRMEIARGKLAEFGRVRAELMTVKDLMGDVASLKPVRDWLKKSLPFADDTESDTGKYTKLIEKVGATVRKRRSELEEHMRDLVKRETELFVWLKRNAKTVGLGAFDERMCPVCMHRPLDVFCDPCGHTFCRECATITEGTCFMCRAAVAQVRKLYAN